MSQRNASGLHSIIQLHENTTSMKKSLRFVLGQSFKCICWNHSNPICLVGPCLVHGPISFLKKIFYETALSSCAQPRHVRLVACDFDPNEINMRPPGWTDRRRPWYTWRYRGFIDVHFFYVCLKKSWNGTIIELPLRWIETTCWRAPWEPPFDLEVR